MNELRFYLTFSSTKMVRSWSALNFYISKKLCKYNK